MKVKCPTLLLLKSDFWLPSRVGCSMKHIFPSAQTDELGIIA